MVSTNLHRCSCATLARVAISNYDSLMSIKDDLIKEIDAYLARSGMNATEFGVAVLNDTAFVHRLRRGKDVRVATVEKVRKWMADHPLARRHRKAEARSAA